MRLRRQQRIDQRLRLHRRALRVPRHGTPDQVARRRMARSCRAALSSSGLPAALVGMPKPTRSADARRSTRELCPTRVQMATLPVQVQHQRAGDLLFFQRLGV